MSLVIFGDGLKGSSHIKYKGWRVGVSEIIYEVLVLDLDEFRVSVNYSNINKPYTIGFFYV